MTEPVDPLMDLVNFSNSYPDFLGMLHFLEQIAHHNPDAFDLPLDEDQMDMLATLFATKSYFSACIIGGSRIMHLVADKLAGLGRAEDVAAIQAIIDRDGEGVDRFHAQRRAEQLDSPPTETDAP